MSFMFDDRFVCLKEWSGFASFVVLVRRLRADQFKGMSKFGDNRTTFAVNAKQQLKELRNA